MLRASLTDMLTRNLCLPKLYWEHAVYALKYGTVKLRLDRDMIQR